MGRLGVLWQDQRVAEKSVADQLRRLGVWRAEPGEERCLRGSYGHD